MFNFSPRFKSSRFFLLMGAVIFSHQAQATDWVALPLTPNENGRASVIDTYVLPATEIELLNPGLNLGSKLDASKNGYSKTDNPGIGSALVAIPNKPGEFYMMTDRGVNFDYVNSSGKVYGKVFPIPDFTPTILHVKLDQGKIGLLRAIPLLDGQGKPVKGLTNDSNDERSYTSVGGSQLPYAPAGLDTEALQLLPDGKFLIAEEYGPSIIVADPDGKVLVRYVPQGKHYETTAYPIKPILPAVLKQRRSNRGFENLALTADGKTAYAILQSPMGDAKNKAYENSRLVRILRLDVSNSVDAKVNGMFAVLQSHKADYLETGKQKDLKYSDAVALSQDKLLLLERATKKVKLITADLSQATNLLEHPLADGLKFEQESDQLTTLSVTPAVTKVVFDSRDIMFSMDTDKIEGLSVLNNAVVLISNDNDFGVGDNTNDYPSKVWLVRLGKPL